MKILNKKLGVTASYLSILLSASLLITGCKKDFLDVPPQAQQPVTQFWQTQEDATAAVNAMYANTRSWTFSAFATMAIESLGSDDASTGTEPSDGSYGFMNEFDTYTVTSSNDRLNDFWVGMYQQINYCNQVLDNIPNINMDDALRARYLLEAKFLRAYSYFRLVRAFGDVPLRLHVPVSGSEYNIPRTPKAEVWAAIQTDLTEAAAGLPASYTGANIGRATKGAALALLAKISIYQSKWTEAKNYSEQVMGMGYSLYTNYEKMFRLEGENCAESIYEIQCAYLPSIPGASNSQYCQIQQARGPFDGNGWGFNTPTQNLADAYEANDPRKFGSILFRGLTSAEGDLIPLTATNPMYNYKSYIPFASYTTTGGSEQNIRVIRLADVLLINAEANNELGNTANALASLELVRKRARDFAIANGAPANTLPAITSTSQSDIRTAIYHERRVELGMDFDSRYFDVIRQGRASTVFGPLGWQANKNEVWPIPQKEIDLSAGMLQQNPGYN
ncbi:MAG: RagB/SusD family nutrient uptake outer membrane protein [Ferruginibacter sp.]